MEFKGGATNAVHAWESAKVDHRWVVIVPLIIGLAMSFVLSPVIV